MKYKIFKLILNIIFVVFWNNYGYDFLLLGLDQLQLTQYFTNISLYIAFLLILRFVPPVWFTYELWFRLRKNN